MLLLNKLQFHLHRPLQQDVCVGSGPCRRAGACKTLVRQPSKLKAGCDLFWRATASALP